MYTLRSFPARSGFFHQPYLLWKVDNSDLHIMVMGHTTASPTSGIPSDIQDIPWMQGENQRKCLVKRIVAVEMVEPEPAFLHILRKRRKPLVYCRPVSEMAQPGRASGLQGLIQLKPSHIIHIMIEIHVHPGSGISKQKPADLCDGKPVGILIDNHCAYRQRRLQQHFCRIPAYRRLRSHLIDGKPIRTVA